MRAIRFAPPEIRFARPFRGHVPVLNLSMHSHPTLTRLLAAVCLSSLFAFLLPALHAQAAFNVRDYGATGNGTSIDSTAVNNAITAANSAGGGTVVFPSGNYRCRTIRLKSNVTLHLEAGATILAATSGFDAPESNPYDDYQDFGHSHYRNSLIFGESLTNIGITGPGTINGDNNLATDEAPAGEANKAIALKLCSGITLSDITVRQGGHFALIVNGCTDLTVTRVKLLNLTDRDGFNLISSSRVRITDSQIEGNDDAMCLKSDFFLGRIVHSDDIHVDNCRITSGENNAIQFGSETRGNFTNVRFTRCTIGGAGKAGLGVTSNDGSIIDGVTFSDITMQNCATPIFIKLSDQNRGPDPTPIGRIRNLSFTNITATRSIRDGVEYSNVIHGKSSVFVENISFNNVRLTADGGHPASDASINPPDNNDWRPRILGELPAYGWFIRHARNITFTNCQVDFDRDDGRPAVIVNNGQNIRFNDFRAERGSSSAYDLGFTNVQGYLATGSTTAGAAFRIRATNSTPIDNGGVASPSFSPPGGPYPTPQSVSITTTTSGATIRYTTDGSTPSATSGTVYTGPVTVSATSTLRAIAYTATASSAVSSASYTIGGGGGNPVVFEAESVSRITSGVSATTDSDTAASGGARVTLNATNTGSWVEFTTPSIPAGTYRLELLAKHHSNRAIHVLRVDGVQLGSTVDQYASPSVFRTTTYGTVTFSAAGTHKIRMVVNSRNSSSSGYTISADRFTLTPQ